MVFILRGIKADGENPHDIEYVRKDGVLDREVRSVTRTPRNVTASFRAKIFKPEDQFNSGDGHANESDIPGCGFEAAYEA